MEEPLLVQTARKDVLLVITLLLVSAVWLNSAMLRSPTLLRLLALNVPMVNTLMVSRVNVKTALSTVLPAQPMLPVPHVPTTTLSSMVLVSNVTSTTADSVRPPTFAQLA